MRLSAQCIYKDDGDTICQSITLTRDNNQTKGLGFLLQWFDPGLFWIGNLTTCWVNTDSVKDRSLCILCWIHAGVRDKNLCNSEGTIFHRDKDWDDKLVSRDVHRWWVAEGNFGRATRITTWQKDLGLWLFDSQTISIPPCCMGFLKFVWSVIWREIRYWPQKEKWTGVKC